VRAGGFGQGNRGGTQSRNIKIDDNDVAAIADLTQAPDVAEVVPSVNVQSAVASYQGATATPGTFTGTTANVFTVRNFTAQYGQVFSADDVANHSRVVVLGTTVVKNLLGANADVSRIVGESVKFGPTNFTVIGVLKSKGSNGVQDQDDIAFAPLTTVRDSLAGVGTRIDSLVVQAKDRAATTPAQTEITTILVARHKGATTNSFQVLNQASLLQTADANNRTFTVLLGAVAAISLLVGGIGVMNIMLVTVTERTREIGIRKAIGARKSHVLAQFLTEAVLLSVIGGILGVAAGLVGSRFKIVGVQPVVELYSIVLAFGVAVVVGLFFGIYPANRAASLRPIEALRYE
jgi:putative ABC transport system permease protein